MKIIAIFAAACALAAGRASAQLPASDFSYSPVSPGSWTYRATALGSEATFVDATGTARLTLSCSRAARQVTLARASAAPAASLGVWTSSASRALASRFEPAARRVVAATSAYDSLLDAVAFSRGRVAVLMPGSPALVVPNGAELAHVVEDCRA